MQGSQVSNCLRSLKAQDYRLGMEKSTDSADTTYIYPNSIDNEGRFMKVATLVSGTQAEIICRLYAM